MSDKISVFYYLNVFEEITGFDLDEQGMDCLVYKGIDPVFGLAIDYGPLTNFIRGLKSLNHGVVLHLIFWQNDIMVKLFC